MTASDTALSPVNRPGAMACPGCAATPEIDVATSDRGDGSVKLALTLPGIHCAGCISTVERVLNSQPGVDDARVNLTLKRANISVSPDVSAESLISALGDAGYEAHALDVGTLGSTERDDAGRDLLMRLGVAGFASMNVMLLSVAVWAGAQDATRDLFHWLSAAIALPAIAFSAQPFFRNAWSALRVGRMNMDVPIALAILLAAATSLYETIHSGAHAYFDAALMLTFFLLAGRYLDHRTRASARSAAQELAALEVPRVIRISSDGTEDTVPLSEVAPGDTVLVQPGGRMPVDGVVLEGKSELDRSLLTGETLPVSVAPGASVCAGEVNLTGPLVLSATAVGEDSSLHALTDLVAVAESGRSRYTSLADKAAKLYAPGVHVLAGLSFLGWYLATRDLRTAVNIAAAVLIITCPCALGLAVPAVTTAASGRLFRRGLLIKDATALERLAEVDTVYFDKTGTLTEGVPVPVDLDSHSPETLAIARALANGSAHPLSKSLKKALSASALPDCEIRDIREVAGYGVEGVWQDQQVRLGRLDWFANDAPTTSQLTATWLKVGTEPPVAFHFQDVLRSGASQAVAVFQAQGLPVRLLSGDTTPAVASLAKRVGIDDWVAGMTPTDKVAEIDRAMEAGLKVLMVGDGLNDTAALARAHVSISPASALDAARVASDIVLLGNDLGALGDARETAVKATRRIKENFRIATVYNIVAVPLAVAGLATPLIAALAMSASSITVSLNALRVGDWRSKSDTSPKAFATAGKSIWTS